MYIALHNVHGVPCLTTLENKRQQIMSYGEKNRKWHSLKAGILKNCDE
jgi:hypothetical protein